MYFTNYKANIRILKIIQESTRKIFLSVVDAFENIAYHDE